MNDLDRLGVGEKIAGVSAVFLLVSMFFDWFGTKSADDSFNLFSVGHSAWEALDFTPIVLLVAVAGALSVVARRLTNAIPAPGTLANAVVAILGIVSVLLILFRIVEPPTFSSIGSTFGPIAIEGTVQLPMYVALLAAAGIAFGGCWALREERISSA